MQATNLQKDLQASNPAFELPQMRSNVPLEPYAIDDGYKDDPVKAYDVTWNQKTAATSNGRDYVRWDTTHANFIRSHSGLGSGWGFSVRQVYGQSAATM